MPIALDSGQFWRLSKCCRTAEDYFYMLCSLEMNSRLKEPVVTYVLINLWDGLSLADRVGMRVADQGPLIAGDDLTELINFTRNAACHITSGSRRAPGIEVGSVWLGAGMTITLAGHAMTNPTSDDVALAYPERMI